MVLRKKFLWRVGQEAMCSVIFCLLKFQIWPSGKQRRSARTPLVVVLVLSLSYCFQVLPSATRLGLRHEVHHRIAMSWNHVSTISRASSQAQTHFLGPIFLEGLEGHMYIAMSSDRPNFLNDLILAEPSSLRILRLSQVMVGTCGGNVKIPYAVNGGWVQEHSFVLLLIMPKMIQNACNQIPSKQNLPNSVPPPTSICHYYHCKINPTHISSVFHQPIFPSQRIGDPAIVKLERSRIRPVTRRNSWAMTAVGDGERYNHSNPMWIHPIRVDQWSLIHSSIYFATRSSNRRKEDPGKFMEIQRKLVWPEVPYHAAAPFQLCVS